MVKSVEVKPSNTTSFWLTAPAIIFLVSITAQKMKFSITDFFSKCDQIRILTIKTIEGRLTLFRTSDIFCTMYWSWSVYCT